MCGEKFHSAYNGRCSPGSPPRVRGKVVRGMQQALRYRITPACAGKSLTIQKLSTLRKDHPRVCGEKQYRIDSRCSHVGSPPRVRGKAKNATLGGGKRGITPACAGKSLACLGPSRRYWDHPRVCGEKRENRMSKVYSRGSPPRVRGKAHVVQNGVFGRGITPACAGKRNSARTWSSVRQDHPRVCGEKGVVKRSAWGFRGSPPRMRGKADPGEQR